MVEHVLVAIDGSEQADLAFDFAIESYPEAEMTLLYVVTPPEVRYLTGDEDWIEDDAHFQEALEEATEFLDGYARKAEEAGVSVTAAHELAYEKGQEARAIISYAEDHDVDLIVMGSHGRTGAARILLGSVAERVVRRSPIPVLVVR